MEFIIYTLVVGILFYEYVEYSIIYIYYSYLD